ncbi:MAG: hypothetical protein ACRDGD_11445 [Candidatus Limnocylindria bacterium]
MTATIGVEIRRSRPELISVTYGHLRRMGFDEPEAANLTALKNGFEITSQPWTVRELTHLLFLRALGRAGRWSSDADDRVDSALPARGRASGPAMRSRLRADANQADGAVRLRTPFRSVVGRNATSDLLRRSAGPRLDAAGDSTRESG